jgi:hypothetical protein
LGGKVVLWDIIEMGLQKKNSRFVNAGIYIKYATQISSQDTRPATARTLPARKPQYGLNIQLTPEVVNSPALAPDAKKRTQQVVGALLYYARAVDPNLMTAISSLACQQVTATEDTDAKLLQLINYCTTHPNARI